MKISEANIRNIISKILLESNLERISGLLAQANAKGYALAHFTDSVYDNVCILYDANLLKKILQNRKINEPTFLDFEKNNIIISGITWYNDEDNCNNAGIVGLSASDENSNMGPVVYEYAMSVSAYGIAPDRTIVSKSARNIWKKYAERPDIKKKKFDDKNNPQNDDKTDDCTLHNIPELDQSYSIDNFNSQFSELTLRHRIVRHELLKTLPNLTELLINGFKKLFKRRYANISREMRDNSEQFSVNESRTAINVNKKITFSEAEKLIEILKKEQSEQFQPQNEQEQELAVMLDMRKEKGTVPDILGYRYDEIKRSCMQNVNDENIREFKSAVLSTIRLNVIKNDVENIMTGIWTEEEEFITNLENLVLNIEKYKNDVEFDFDVKHEIDMINRLEGLIMSGDESVEITNDEEYLVLKSIDRVIDLLRIIDLSVEDINEQFATDTTLITLMQSVRYNKDKFLTVIKTMRFMQEWNEYAN